MTSIVNTIAASNAATSAALANGNNEPFPLWVNILLGIMYGSCALILIYMICEMTGLFDRIRTWRYRRRNRQ